MTHKATTLITALDVDTQSQALDLAGSCGACAWFKVGFQLYTRCGPAIVEELLSRGKQVFLDLKLHDIPNTVAKAARASADLGAGLLTMHALAGKDAVAAARAAVEGTDTRLLAVTILTSHTDDTLRKELGIPESSAIAVPRLARLAVEAGAHGIVCSPLEITAVREAVGPDALIVTPGIRPAWAAANDQARIMTPADAAAAGADFIVVGRPITHHESPAEAVGLILGELTP